MDREGPRHAAWGVPVKSHSSTNASTEWRAYWPLVFACFMGMTVQPSAYYGLGLFIQPMTDEFGWSRTEVSVGASIAAMIHIPLAPLIGNLADRWGVRRIAVPGTLLTGMAIAGFALANGSSHQWIGLWVAYALVSVTLKSVIWAKAISGRFEAARSMALSVALSGSTLTVALVPPLSRWLIDLLGWREAWMVLGLGIGIATFIPCALFLRDSHDDIKSQSSRETIHPTREFLDLPGLSLRQASTSPVLWRIGLATLIILTLNTTFLLHKVPILVEAGLSRASAAWLTSLSGIAAFAGTFAIGWLMDRFDAGRVGFVSNALAGLSLILMIKAFRTPELIVISMIILGFTGGAKLQMCAYLTSRYAGMRNYGTIFGVMSGIVAVSGGAGSVLGGLAYDLYGSYDLLIASGIPMGLLAAFLILGLGPYPAWNVAKPTGGNGMQA